MVDVAAFFAPAYTSIAMFVLSATAMVAIVVTVASVVTVSPAIGTPPTSVRRSALIFVIQPKAAEPSVRSLTAISRALPEPLPLEVSSLLKKLRAIGQREGERLNIAPELMLRKKTLEALLKTGYPKGPYQLPESLRGWRRELMGQALLDCLAATGESA